MFFWLARFLPINSSIFYILIILYLFIILNVINLVSIFIWVFRSLQGNYFYWRNNIKFTFAGALTITQVTTCSWWLCAIFIYIMYKFIEMLAMHFYLCPYECSWCAHHTRLWLSPQRMLIFHLQEANSIQPGICTDVSKLLPVKMNCNIYDCRQISKSMQVNTLHVHYIWMHMSACSH